jgi:hypothetical protein
LRFKVRNDSNAPITAWRTHPELPPQKGGTRNREFSGVYGVHPYLVGVTDISPSPSKEDCPMLLLSMLVGLQLIAADNVPTLDVGPGCRATVGIADVSPSSCFSDEKAAHNQLLKEWSQFSAADKTLCVGEATGFEPSYVELLTCLELMRDARTPYGAQE